MATVSINLSKLSKDKLFTSEKTGDTFANLVVWINSEPDKYGNHISVQESVSKEAREAGEKGKYVGNGRVYESKKSAQVKASTAAQSTKNDLPW